MNKLLKNNRFLISRRIVQVSLIILFAGGNVFGWNILRGNLSAASILDSVPLSDPFATLQIVLAGGVVLLDLWLGALIVIILYGLIFGRAFCSWICPVNPIIDLARWIKKKSHLSFIKLPVTRNFRYYFVFLSLLLSIILGYAAFELISPVSLLYRGLVFGIGLGWGFIVAIFLFEIMVTERLWCSRICPLGGSYSIISQRNILKVYHSEENCTRCNLCFDVCPEVQVLKRVGKSSGTISNGACTNCARCIEVCEDKALKFSIFKRH